MVDSDNEYRVEIFGHKIEVTGAIRDYIMTKLHKVERITHQVIDATIRLEVNKLEHMCEVVLKFTHFKVVVHATTTDLYASIDKAFERLQAKMRRWKSKIQEHHARKPEIEELPVSLLEMAEEELAEINDQIEEENLTTVERELYPAKVASTKTIPLKTLNIDEAIMKMELSDDNFMVYRCEEDQKLKVIYRRRDGSYGIIAAEEKTVS